MPDINQLRVASAAYRIVNFPTELSRQLFGQIHQAMSAAWTDDAAAVFETLGADAAQYDTHLSNLIGLYLIGDPTGYARLPRPKFYYVKCDNGFIVSTTVPFGSIWATDPVAATATTPAVAGVPLARWSIPAANKTAAQALVAGKNAEELRALLLAAQA